MAKHGPLKPDGKDSRAPQIGPLPERTFSASPLPLGDSASTLSKATVAANGQLRVPGGRSATQARVGPDAPFLRRRVWDADTRVAVIGAGIGGLAAAMHLKRLGYRHVEVLEKDAAVGGMCRGVEVGGRWYDLGGQFLARGASPTVTRLAAELGADWEELGDVFGGVVELETGGGVRAFEAPLRQAVKARQVLRFLNEVSKRLILPGASSFAASLVRRLSELSRDDVLIDAPIF